MIKRLMKFHFNDWRHIVFLLNNASKNIHKGDYLEAKDALYRIRIHLTYDSNKVK